MANLVDHTFHHDGMMLTIQVTPEEAARYEDIERYPHKYHQHAVDLTCCTDGSEEEPEEQDEEEFGDNAWSEPEDREEIVLEDDFDYVIEEEPEEPDKPEYLNALCECAFWEGEDLLPEDTTETRQAAQVRLTQVHLEKSPECLGELVFFTNTEAWGHR